MSVCGLDVGGPGSIFRGWGLDFQRLRAMHFLYLLTTVSNRVLGRTPWLFVVPNVTHLSCCRVVRRQAIANMLLYIVFRDQPTQGVGPFCRATIYIIERSPDTSVWQDIR